MRPVQLLDQVLHVKEVIMDASCLYEGALILRNKVSKLAGCRSEILELIVLNRNSMVWLILLRVFSC
jgi:hypothetical protein